ncbi:MAG: RAD55 family ATPase [Candidatus Hydrothermarchaeota archaeon]
MVKLLQTWIENLDNILGGGIPAGSNIFLYGPPGSGKTSFSISVLSKNLENGVPCLCITMDESPRMVRERFADFGCDTKEFEDENLFQIIDCYTWRLGEWAESTEKRFVSSLRDLNQLIRLFIESMEELKIVEKGGIVLFDTLSTLVMYAGLNLTYKATNSLTAMIREANAISFLVLEEGVHEERTMATLNYITEGTIRFKTEHERLYFRVERLKRSPHMTHWIPFKLSSTGLEIIKVR